MRELDDYSEAEPTPVRWYDCLPAEQKKKLQSLGMWPPPPEFIACLQLINVEDL